MPISSICQLAPCDSKASWLLLSEKVFGMDRAPMPQ